MDIQQLTTTLFEQGGHLGYRRTRRHPSVREFLYATRNRLDIINLEVTSAQIESARSFLLSIIESKKGQILFVGTKAEARHHLVDIANHADMPYVEERWIGGTLTNSTEIKKRIDTMIDLTKKQALGELVYKTKKEKLLLERKIAKLTKMFGGLRHLEGTPVALVVVDPRKEHIAVDEARKKQIPVIAIGNTDCDLSLADYPICVNDASQEVLKTVLESLVREHS